MQHIYISYPADDAAFAHRLVDDLQAAGYIVFVDAVSLTGTVAWAAETRQAIRSCGAMVMILSPENGRRIGIRHEGVLAKRRNKSVVVVRRSPGDVPRYVAQAPVVDCWREEDYEPARDALIRALPAAALLMVAPTHVAPRRVRRPPRQPEQARQRRRVVIVVSVLIVLALIVLAGIAFGVIPG